jgi:predicted transposase YbfD/YdcC
MTEGDAVVGAVTETTVFLSYFKDLPDYRQTGKITYPLEEVLLLMLAAALAGAETVADMARFGRAKLEFLQRFRLFEKGTPSHDQLGIILARLDPAGFQRCFVAWTAALTKTSAEVIAIDGKTVRRSYQKKGAEAPIHVVSAFAARQRMVLGQTKVGDKSNEIVAIPALLALLDIEGAVVTIDAMGCQRNIAQTIIDKKADYILALKGNQGTLRDDVELFAREQKAVAFKNTKVSQDRTVDGDHGRIETRTVTVFQDIGWLQDNHQWPALKSVVMVESERETDGKVETETRFYITSLALLAVALGPMIRSHWMVENGLHWVLDMVFRDDECRVRTDNAPFNLAIVKHIALNLLRTGKSKDSLRMRRKVAAWDDNALTAYIAA